MSDSKNRIPKTDEKPIKQGYLEYIRGEYIEKRNRDIPEISRKTTVYQPIEDTTGPAPKGSKED